MPLKRYGGGAPPPTRPVGPSAEDDSFLSRMGGFRGLLGTGARIGSGLLATEGGPIGGAIATAGEGLAQMLEGSKFNPGRMAVEGSLGMVPLASVFKLGKAGTSALRSGTLSAVGTAGRELSMGEDLDPRAIAESGGLGALLGGVIGHMSSPPKAAPSGRVLETQPTAQQGGHVLSSKGKGVVDSKGGITRSYVPDSPPAPSDYPMGAHSPVDFRRPEVPPVVASSSEELQQELDDIARLSGEPTAPSKLDSQLNSWAADDELKAEEQARKRGLINTSGMKRGKPSIRESVTAQNEDGSTISQSTPFQPEKPPRAPRKSNKASKTASIAKQLGVAESNAAREILMQEHDTGAGVPPTGLGKFFGVKDPQKFPSEGPTVGVGRFFGVQQPLEAPRQPRALSPKQQAAAESERLLKLKMAEEAQPRPAEWDQYPPEVTAEMDRLGLQYRGAPEGLEKRGLGAQLSELRMFMSGKNAKNQPYMRDSWRGAPDPAQAARNAAAKLEQEAVEKPTNYQTPAGQPTEDWIAKETASAEDIGRQLEQQAGGPPTDINAPDWVKEQSGIVDKLRAMLMNQSGGGSERGAISPELLHFLGMGAGGALIGGITNPTGDPLTSAAIGGAAGVVGATFGPQILRGMQDIGGTKEAIEEAAQRVTAEGPKKTAQRIFETWPMFQRFNMLMDPVGLPANAVGGPWGSAMTGAIEAGLSGDERGWRLAKALSTPEFATSFPKHWNDAVELIRNGDLGRAETILYNSRIGKGMSLPGTVMTTGDVTAREMGKARGFTEDEMRGMTMTNEPEFTGFQKIAEFTKNSPMLQTVMPFTRTLANMGEQGAMRAPVIGLFVQAMREAPDPIKTQLVQQAMSVGIGGANYFLGQNLSPEEARVVRRFATNMSGRYGIIAGAGFAAGQASAQGKPPLSAGLLRATQETLPLPTTEIPESWAKFIGAKLEGGNAPLPRGIMPTEVQNKLFPTSQPAPRMPRTRIRRPQ